MTKPCLICSRPVKAFLDFGRMPRGNGFLDAGAVSGEFFFNLSVGFCESCFMVQLLEQPEPEAMFHARYPFFTGSSNRMTDHFKRFAEDAARDYLPSSNPFVVEIGSNDGSLLNFFRSRRIRHLGVDPSSNVSGAAREKGVETLCDFFNEALAARIRAEHAAADLILAANVMCHIASFRSVLSGIELLLKDRGTVIFEEPYLGDVIQKTAYDQIYDEHVFLFSLHAMQNALAPHNLELFDAKPQGTHGGSMRYFVGKKGYRVPSYGLQILLRREAESGLTDKKTFTSFSARCEKSRDRLRHELETLKEEGATVAGYGATSKSTTVLNYAGITPELLPYLCDTTPEKQGKWSPGAHIPILPPEAFRNPYPSHALLFAWNHAEEIIPKEGQFTASGGRWLVYVPEVKFL